jgi:hypothetical protein
MDSPEKVLFYRATPPGRAAIVTTKIVSQAHAYRFCSFCSLFLIFHVHAMMCHPARRFQAEFHVLREQGRARSALERAAAVDADTVSSDFVSRYVYACPLQLAAVVRAVLMILHAACSFHSSAWTTCLDPR